MRTLLKAAVSIDPRVLSAYDSPEQNFCVCMCVCAKVCSTHRAKTGVSESLKLELQVLISYLMWAPGAELRPSA